MRQFNWGSPESLHIVREFNTVIKRIEPGLRLAGIALEYNSQIEGMRQMHESILANKKIRSDVVRATSKVGLRLLIDAQEADLPLIPVTDADEENHIHVSITKIYPGTGTVFPFSQVFIGDATIDRAMGVSYRNAPGFTRSQVEDVHHFGEYMKQHGLTILSPR